MRVEFRWTDPDDRGFIESSVDALGGAVVRRLDGLLVADLPADAIRPLRDLRGPDDRRLVYSFPAPPPATDSALAAREPDDPFSTRVKLTSGAVESTVKGFAARSKRVGMKKGLDSFIVRKEPRKRRNPAVDGPTDDLASPGTPPDLDTLLPEDTYLVKLKGPIEPKWRAELLAIAPLGDHRPPDTFRMVLSPDQMARLLVLEYVGPVQRYGLLDTLTPAMVQALDAAGEEGVPGVGHFDVTVHVPDAVPRVVALLEKSGVRVAERSGTSVRIELPADSPLLSAIAQMPEVRTLTPFEACDLMLDRARAVLGLHAVNPTPPPAGAVPWDGAGETVAVFDSGIDATHPDLAPAVTAAPAAFRHGVADDTHGHGTHVAGILVGRGVASGGRVLGVAPAAVVKSFGIVDAAGRLIIPLDLGEMLKLAVAAGASVINLSWGKKLRVDYDVYGASIDKFARENPDVLIVVAAGNEGAAVTEDGPRLGRHRSKTIGMPAAAKNVVTVGACCNLDGVPPFPHTWGHLNGSQFADPPARDEPVVAAAPFPAAISSRGPTGFDAVKPDLLAPGTLVLSARAAATRVSFVNHPLPPALAANPPRYAYLNGTSMAAPMVAGGALLLRQFLRTAHATPAPSAALLKALLVLAADRIPAANRNSVLYDNPPTVAVGFPDFDQGFGVLNLRNVLPHPAAPADRVLAFHEVANDSPAALEARVEEDSPRRAYRMFKVDVPADSATPLRVAVAWTDVPGRGVQNLLSLEVKGPGVPSRAGNHDRLMFLDQDAIANGATAFDKLNTVQVVTIPTPQKGTYRITVRAEATTAPPQGYALAVLGPIPAAPLTPLF